MLSGRTTGIVCTVLGGMLGLWVTARLSNLSGQQQTWGLPLEAYEWATLAGAVIAAGLLIVGLVRLTEPTEHESH